MIYNTSNINPLVYANFTQQSKGGLTMSVIGWLFAIWGLAKDVYFFVTSYKKWKKRKVEEWTKEEIARVKNEMSREFEKKLEERKKMNESKIVQSSLEISTNVNLFLSQTFKRETDVKNMIGSPHLVSIIEVISLTVLQGKNVGWLPIFPTDNNDEVRDKIFVFYFRRQIDSFESLVDLMKFDKDLFGISKNYDNFENIPLETKPMVTAKMLVKMLDELNKKGLSSILNCTVLSNNLA